MHRETLNKTPDLASGAVSSSKAWPVPPELAEPPQHTVICIDDDPEFLYSVESSLPHRLAARSAVKTECEFFTSPTAALERLQEREPSEQGVAMIVSDHLMPDMTGLELLEQAKQLAPFAVRVLLTGQLQMETVVRGLNNGIVDHYVRKPLEDLDLFAERLAGLLNRYHLEARQRHESWRAYEQYEFLRDLTRLKTLQETLDTVVHFVARLLHAERVSLMLCEDGLLRIRAARGLRPEVVRSTSLPVGSGVAGAVFASGAPMYVNDTAESGLRSSVDTPYSVFASVPLVVAPMSLADQPLGTINVTNRRGDRPLTAAEMSFLSHTADAACIAISNQLERQRRESAHFGIVRSLALAVEAKDRYTRGHSERVAYNSVRIGSEMGLAAEDIDLVERAAILHDVGKIGVPEHIIHKPGSLTAAEFEHIRQHPVVGERIVSQLTFMADALPIVRGHHERLDGTGYPDGLPGTQIPLGARIVAVADAYDAMTSERPYREPMSHASGMAELSRCSGTQFCPRCVEAFLKVLGRPTGPQAVLQWAAR